MHGGDEKQGAWNSAEVQQKVEGGGSAMTTRTGQHMTIGSNREGEQRYDTRLVAPASCVCNPCHVCSALSAARATLPRNGSHADVEGAVV